MRLDPDRSAVRGARFVELLEKLGANCDGGFNSFTHLFEIAFAGAATFEARFDVVQNPTVGRDVLVGKRDEMRETHNVDVGLCGVESDQLGALAHAISGRVDTGSLAPDFVDRRQTIEQKLTDDDRIPRVY